MEDFTTLDGQPPARMVAGALAHLAKHMETGCPRAAYLAAMLLAQVADDREADAHLRAHARELVDIRPAGAAGRTDGQPGSAAGSDSPGTQGDAAQARRAGAGARSGSRAGRESIGLIDAGTSDEFLTRALRRAIEQDKSRLEYGQTFLATVASSAPFVGLFGTVWGIYHALMAIGISGQGTLDKVAGPVGEALIMTAVGLAVAIPAAVAYNAFAHDVFIFLAMGLKHAPRNDVAATSERIIARVASRAA